MFFAAVERRSEKTPVV